MPSNYLLCSAENIKHSKNCAFWIQLLTALALPSNLNSKNLFQQYLQQLWLPLLQSIFKIHRLNWDHFSVRTKQSRVQKKQQSVSKGRVASHKSSPVFSPNKRATREVILVQHPFYRTLHPKLERICCYHKHSSPQILSLQVTVAWLAQVKKVQATSIESPVLTQWSWQPTFVDWVRAFEIQASI